MNVWQEVISPHLLVALWLRRLLLFYLLLLILLLLLVFVRQDVVQPGQVVLGEHQIQQLPYDHQTQNLKHSGNTVNTSSGPAPFLFF